MNRGERVKGEKYHKKEGGWRDGGEERRKKEMDEGR